MGVEPMLGDVEGDGARREDVAAIARQGNAPDRRVDRERVDEGAIQIEVDVAAQGDGLAIGADREIGERRCVSDRGRWRERRYRVDGLDRRQPSAVGLLTEPLR